MPFYQRLGDVPRKRHIQFRDNGTLLTEEVMGLEGFSGNESILYHLQSPCRVMEVGDFEPIVREEWVPDTHQHRMMHTREVEPGGDEVTGRRLLMWNSDIEVSVCKPTEEGEALMQWPEMVYQFHREGFSLPGTRRCWRRRRPIPTRPSATATMPGASSSMAN